MANDTSQSDSQWMRVAEPPTPTLAYKLALPGGNASLDQQSDGRWWAAFAVSGASSFAPANEHAPLEAAVQMMVDRLNAAIDAIRQADRLPEDAASHASQTGESDG